MTPADRAAPELSAEIGVGLGVAEVDELVGGHQSRVFRVVVHDGRPAVAKVLDASMVERSELDTRLDVTVALAELDPRVCRPLSIGGRLVTAISSGDQRLYVVCYEFANGTEPDPTRTADARLMGTTLATLHLAMSRLPASPLPVVSALRNVPAEDVPASGPYQLLHGDFSASNLRTDGDGVRIFDLDDCGYGPAAYDIANALYMVLFDAVTHGSTESYTTFRRSFVDGYVDGSGSPLQEETLDELIDLRVRALGSWLADLEHAPIGIRTASSAWRSTLRTFVTEHRGAQR